MLYIRFIFIIDEIKVNLCLHGYLTVTKNHLIIPATFKFCEVNSKLFKVGGGMKGGSKKAVKGE